MSRSRYWKLTKEEVEKLSYEPAKMINWEIKCIREPKEDAIFVGVFLYKNGTPYDYESVKGIAFYHNHIPREEISSITKYLKGKFGGKDMEKGDRIILKGSEEIYNGQKIAQLAKEMESKFNTEATISMEFQDLTPQEQKDSGLPEAKLLPIPGK